MHSDRFYDVSEAYAAFLLRVGKSLHCLPLNSEYDVAHSCLKSVGTKRRGAMFQKVMGYTDKRRCRTYSEFGSIITQHVRNRTFIVSSVDTQMILCESLVDMQSSQH